MQRKIESFIISKTNIKSKDIKYYMNKDSYLTPDECLNLRIIDQKINKFSDLKLKGW